MPEVQNLQAYSNSGNTYPQVYGTSVYWNYPAYGYYNQYYLHLEYDTDCGHVNQYVYFNNTCSYNYSYNIYPNPTDDELTVSYESTEPGIAETQHNTKSKKEYKVELINNKGEKMRTGQSKDSKTLTLDTKTIPNGFYFLHIIEGNNVIKKQIIIEHK